MPQILKLLQLTNNVGMQCVTPAKNALQIQFQIHKSNFYNNQSNSFLCMCSHNLFPKTIDSGSFRQSMMVLPKETKQQIKHS